MTDHTRAGTVTTATPKIIFDVPHSARIWNYWLAGKDDNYPVDHVAGDLWQDTHPEIVTLATQSRRFVLAGSVALENDVRQWIKNWNQDPKPFIWTKTAEDIPRSLSKYIARISGG